MTLPHDTARCLGRVDRECSDCARRIQRSAATDRTWWMVPPITRPCPSRIEQPEETTT